MISDKKSQQKLLQEFRSFVSGHEVVPQALSNSLFAKVKQDLNPTFLRVFVKLGLVQLFVGLLTLVFCPQLGVGPLVGEHGIMMFFMHYGPEICAAVCGALYLGISMPLGFFLLRPEELRRARQTQLVYVPLLSAISLVLLMVLGASGTLLIYFFWIAGAVVGGEIGAQLVSFIRASQLKKLGT